MAQQLPLDLPSLAPLRAHMTHWRATRHGRGRGVW